MIFDEQKKHICINITFSRKVTYIFNNVIIQKPSNDQASLECTANPLAFALFPFLKDSILESPEDRMQEWSLYQSSQDDSSRAAEIGAKGRVTLMAWR